MNTTTTNTKKTTGMTMRSRAVALLAGVAAALVLAIPLAADAAPAPSIKGFQMARFKVEIEGHSTKFWRSMLKPETECDTTDNSYGNERLTFSTKKPFVITATHFPDELNPQIFSGRSTLGAPVVVRVRRSYTPDVLPPARICGDNGGGAEPVRPDCGTRTIRNWHVEIEFSEEKRNGLQLHGDDSARDPYENCPSAPWSFPNLVDIVNARTQEPLYADLSPDDLFDPKLEKWITIGNGSYAEDTGSLSALTRIHWTVSFTRLKGK